MPVSIIVKRKTEPQDITQHSSLVPLRVVEIRQDRLRSVDREKYSESISVGDVCVILPGAYSSCGTFNCTKGRMLDNRWLENGCSLFLRAYDVQQIVLTNDDTPAPVV